VYTECTEKHGISVIRGSVAVNGIDQVENVVRFRIAIECYPSRTDSRIDIGERRDRDRDSRSDRIEQFICQFSAMYRHKNVTSRRGNRIAAELGLDIVSVS